MALNFTEQFDMSGYVAVVTGGGTGLGSYMATSLAKNGAKVYITGRRAEVLTKLAESFQGPGSIIPLPMDVTDEESIKKGVQVVTEKEGKLDILINNAGTNTSPSQPDFPAKGMEYFSQGKLPYELETFEGWNYLFKLNTLAPFFVTTAFMDLLIKGAVGKGKKTSVVINISSNSTALKVAFPAGSVSYPITKAALEHMTTFMAGDLAQRKIPVRVVALAPGVFPSEGLSDALLEEYKDKAFPGFLSPAPLLRWGKPEELALSANYLVANEYVNGTVLRLDGGFSLVNL
ncbi:short-chain dehydrogenase [Gymnopus androsaceus JB14]|uniref:Short-chain dehydrogenase n=1 Tax=Gymnopus androsaceus JB14 TaxID=1447944 RepID=A0A6A4HC18_9AGAR|nr:short-chain dehydrogenase [Gymnopus androsaceus JB14]